MESTVLPEAFQTNRKKIFVDQRAIFYIKKWKMALHLIQASVSVSCIGYTLLFSIIQYITAVPPQSKRSREIIKLLSLLSIKKISRNANIKSSMLENQLNNI